MRSTLLLWLLCCTLLLPTLALADANEDVPVVGSTDELFQLLHAQSQPGDPGVSIEDALKNHVAGGEVDEGTYPPSDLWERQFNAWREPGYKFSYNGRVRFKYSEDKISKITKWEKELELNGKYGDWSVSTRFSDLNEFAYVNDPMRWQKFRLSYKGKDYRATVGSVGAVFGRGLALNMFEDRLLEFDNEVEGARVDYNFGRSDMTVIAGTRKDRSAPHDSTVAGVQVRTKLDHHWDAGAYYVDVAFPDAGGGGVVTSSVGDAAQTWRGISAPTPPNMNRLQAIGADLAVRSGRFSAYTEVVQLNRPKQPWSNNQWQSDGADGHGSYTTASYAGNGYSLTGEYKDYVHLDQPFAVLPTVRRWEEKATATPDDDHGYNFQLLMTPKNGSSLLVTYGQDRAHPPTERPFSEFIQTYTSASKHGFSYIVENFRIFDEITLTSQQRVTLNHKVDKDWSSSAVFKRQNLQSPFSGGHTFLLFDAELAYRSTFDIVFTNETDNQTGAAPDQWDLFEVKYHPDDKQDFSLTYGSRRSGYVCSGGVCRLEPAFDGAKAEYLLRF